MSATPAVQGDCAPRFAAVRDAFAATFAAGREVGNAIAQLEDRCGVLDAGRSDCNRLQVAPR